MDSIRTMSGTVLPLSTEVKLGWGVDSMPMLKAGGTREVVTSEGRREWRHWDNGESLSEQWREKCR